MMAADEIALERVSETCIEGIPNRGKMATP